MTAARAVFVLLACAHWYRDLLPPAEFPHGGVLVTCSVCQDTRAVVVTR